ncbi:TM2 domain protein [Roseovarius gaetbuli]|uniref:TM2 domain protein n=1 Tax=Roseovarius gaetbuli TaxID=1356575 RepID=A0A1X6YBT1_9RHOB|nr:TM2 domain-containing protein [Roseovarius gaetbuli]SLN16052.1 TM2 domain protein [Roseovarius gaetbuli]
MSLSTEQMVLVEQRLSNEKKSIGMVYLLWLFLGVLGIHRFYLGKTRSAVGMLVLTILGGFTLMVSIGAFLLIGLGIWLLVDAFLIPGMIKADSQAKRAMIANEVNIMANSKFT